MKPLLLLLTVMLSIAGGSARAQTNNPILIGQSASVSGGQAQYAKDVKVGIEAYFNAINKQGGVRGRPVQLVTLDDGGKKDAVVQNTKKLIEDEKVVALIGYTSGAGVEATLPLLDTANVPMIAPVTGNMGIRANFHRALFHTRAGYSDEMRKVVDHMVLTGLTRIAIAFLDDVGPANPKAMHDALARHNLKPVAAVPLNRNADNFELQTSELLKAKPELVIFISNSKPIVKIIQAMRARGYNGQFASSSFSGVKVIEELQQASHGLILSQVLPPPHRVHLKLVADYQAHLRALDPAAAPNYTSLEGYLSARVLVEGLKKSSSFTSGAKLIAALEDIDHLDLGGYEISFSNKNHNGSRFVNTGVVAADRNLRF
jgi:branched-chain amino acid transport system substrate-binding protein